MAQTFEDRAGAVAQNGQADASARGMGRLTVWALALLGGALFGAAILLWARHGATVFFDTMSAGLGSCL